MRKFITLCAFLFLTAIGYLTYAHLSGAAVPVFGLPLGGEKAKIRQRALSFFEHVKFKNASAMADFVAAEYSKEDLEAFIAKSFDSPSEQIDLLEVKIESIELDSSKLRARIRIRFIGQNISTKTAMDNSKVFFLYRDHDDRWLVDIKNLSP